MNKPIYQDQRLMGAPPLSHIRNNQGAYWSEFKKQLKPKYRYIAYYLFTAIFMLLLGGMALYQATENNDALYLQVLLILLTSVWFSIWMTVICNHFHEAAHYNLCKNKKLNDTLATWLLTPFVGLEIKSYRSSHWQHHKYLGTQKDTEISYHRPITLKNLLLSVSGVHLVMTVLRYAGVYSSNQIKTQEQPSKTKERKAFFRALLILAIFQSTLVLCLFFFGFWQVSIAWVLNLILITPFFSMLRQTLEHRSITAQPDVNYTEHCHGPVNRMFGTGWFAKLFGAAGFNRHLLHHWEPSISYTNFDEFENYLLDTELKQLLENTQTTYLKTFKELIQ